MESKLCSTATVEIKKVFQWISDLALPEKREKSLSELNKWREHIPDLGVMLWHSFGTVAIFLLEITEIYSSISPPTLTHQQSARVGNTLLLLQCIASHPETNSQFLASQIPIYLYPFLRTNMQTSPFEYVRMHSLGVIAALIKTDNKDVICFLLETEAIPICLKVIEIGSEISKTVAMFIMQKILFNRKGLIFVCQKYERFCLITKALDKTLSNLKQKQSPRLLKHTIGCYLHLSQDEKAKKQLKVYLPALLCDTAFINDIQSDNLTKLWLTQLLENLQDNNDNISEFDMLHKLHPLMLQIK